MYSRVNSLEQCVSSVGCLVCGERYLSLQISLDCQHVFISLLLLFLVRRMQRYNKSRPNAEPNAFDLHIKRLHGVPHYAEPAHFFFGRMVFVFFLVHRIQQPNRIYVGNCFRRGFLKWAKIIFRLSFRALQIPCNIAEQNGTAPLRKQTMNVRVRRSICIRSLCATLVQEYSARKSVDLSDAPVCHT